MSKKSFAGGLVVEFPDGLVLHDRGGKAVDGLHAKAKAITEDNDIVRKALAGSTEFTTVAVLEFTGGVKESRLAALRDKYSTEDVTVRLPIGDDEGAVLLSECDGVWRWEYPEFEVSTKGGLGAIKRKQKVAVFKSRFHPVVDGKQTPEKLDFDSSLILKPIEKVVLRFAVRKAAETLSQYLERDIKETPMVLSKGSDGVMVWEPVSSFSEILNTDGNKTILIFVHGTFSSTTGSFGGLSSTQAGSKFLSHALETYDAVIGYDHKTLTKSVEENANEFLSHLDALLPGDVIFDAVAFSRGGLVLRYLTETLLPNQARPFSLRNVAFVGCTNNGTKLADPRYWKDLVDIYTNLVSAAGHVVGWIGGPGIQLTAEIVSGALRGVLSFVRCLASETLNEEVVPGLGSMNPHGQTVTQLNKKTDNHPLPSTVGYHLVEANFDHKLFEKQIGPLEHIGLKQHLFLEFADNFIDQLFEHDPNDLVVDCSSMTQVAPFAPPDWIRDHKKFDHTTGVYHTTYFSNESVAKQIAAWLS